MTKSFFIRLVLLNTFRRRLRVVLVVGGISISSAVMIVLFGVSSGLHGMLNKQASDVGSTDVVTVDQRDLQAIRLDSKNIAAISSIAGVGQVEQSVSLVGALRYDESNLNLPVYGITPGYFSVTPATFTNGSGADLGGNSIVVSTETLNALGVDRKSAVGKQISLAVTTTPDQASAQTAPQVTAAEADFTISGVVDKGSTPTAYVSLDRVRQDGVDTATQLKIRATTPSNVPTVRESIEQMGFQTSSVQDTIDQIDKLFSVIQKVLFIFSVIVFVITVAGTFTIISLTLMEEMRQISFLRISGTDINDVKMLFILQSIVLTTMGAFCGIVLGLIGGGFVNGIARTASAQGTPGEGGNIFAIPMIQMSLVLVLSVAIGWVVGMLPAKRAALVNPMEELG